MKRLVLAVLAALLLIVPAADAKAFRATVVKRNLATHTVVAATRAGTLKVLHNRRDRVGTILRINGRHVKAVGHARRVKIRGIVVRHTARTVTLSAGRATVRIRTAPRPPVRPAARAPARQRPSDDREDLGERRAHGDDRGRG